MLGYAIIKERYWSVSVWRCADMVGRTSTRLTVVKAHELNDDKEDPGDVGPDEGEGGEGADLALEVVPVGVRVRHGPRVAMS